MVVVKFQYGNDVRRITLPDTIAYEEVLSVVERIYGDNALPREFNLKYTDEEKDLIKLTSDNELRDVFSNRPEGKILRLTIVDANPAPSSTGISVAAIDENLYNVLCRHCGRQVLGVLYVCVNCASADHYSLCAECEVQRPHDPQHVFLKVYAPLPPDALARVLPLPNLYAPSAPSAAAQSRGAREASEECPNWIRQRKNVVDLGRAACYQTGTGDRSRQEQGDANKLACRFVADITVDDGHEASPGSPFVKIWRLRNSGHAAWPEGVTLSFVSGDCLSSFDSVPVIAVSPGAEVDVSVDMVAPMETGRYVSNWRLRSPSGVFFGHRVWADVTVAARPPDGDLEKSNGRNEGGGQSVQNEDEDDDDDDIVEEDDEESDREWGQIRRNKVHKIAKVIRSSLNSDVDTYDDEEDEDENEGEAQVQGHKEEEVEEEEEEKSTEEVVEERSGDEEAEKSELPTLETLPVEAKEGDAEDDGEWEVVQQPEEWADELATLMEMSLGDGETIKKALRQANGNVQVAAQALLGE